ncbi:MAG: ATP-dependent DNA helicase RecG [Butyrivibrio sp.]|nr:ATP-dependent DNA helicase RecG [Butyrivibrio sp.]
MGQKRSTRPDLQEPVQGLKGIGDKSAQLFQKCGIRTVEELLCYYPRDYDIYREPCTVAAAPIGVLTSIRVRIVGGVAGRYVRHLHLSVFKAGDETGEISCTCFNMPYLRNILHSGMTYILRGVVQRKGNRLCMDQPKLIREEEYAALTGTMQPRYPLVKGLTNNAIVKAMRQAVERTPYLEDLLDQETRAGQGLIGIQEAVRTIHFPKDEGAFRQARERIVFDEFLLFLLQLRFLKREEERSVNHFPHQRTEVCDQLIAALPYTLTEKQQLIWQDIRGDLEGPHVMNRLIQGDVGSGKTILAFLALLETAANGYQGAMMAPTEVLARQHYENMQELVQIHGLPLRPVLLLGSLTSREKREAREGIRSGAFNCVLGTNALIQESVDYERLALVITDEQHRFGVRQRERLAHKGANVHVLSMSATPIPRTLAIILYGDLHISLLDELPGGRVPIKNCVVGVDYREKAYRFIAGQVAEGRQAYVICPMIEAGEMEDLENVTDYADMLSTALPEQVRIGVLHGRMKPAEKEQIMDDFAAGRIDVLVSTTVIEVGINVPNATVMMIENAERFGLAQLHQLRGRVGRGSHQSYCIFLNTSGSEESKSRLEIMNHSNDGFAIAEEDLKQRGPGDLFGIRQSGDMAFHVGDIYQDAALLRQASSLADRLVADDPDLTEEAHAALRARVMLMETQL